MKKHKPDNRKSSNKPRNKKNKTVRKSTEPSDRPSTKVKTTVVVTLIEFAKKMYEKHGKGIVFINPFGSGYLMPTNRDFSSTDKALIEAVDFENTFALIDLDVSGVAAALVFTPTSNASIRKYRMPCNWLENSEKLLYA